jgi:hypothetical protein
VLCQQLPSVEKSHCTVHKSKKIEWGMMYKLYALILLAYSYWWNISYYEESEIKDTVRHCVKMNMCCSVPMVYVHISSGDRASTHILTNTLHRWILRNIIESIDNDKVVSEVQSLKWYQCKIDWYTATHIHFYTMTNYVYLIPLAKYTIYIIASKPTATIPCHVIT